VVRPAPQHADTVVTRAPANPPLLMVPPDTTLQKPTPPFVPAQPEAPLDRSSWILWTPRVSRLAIPRFLAGDAPFAPMEGWQLKYPLDARTVQLSVDPERGVVRTSLSAADVPLGEAREVPLDAYARELTGQSLRREWVTQSMARINHVPAEAEAQGKKGPLEFTLPVQMPLQAVLHLPQLASSSARFTHLPPQQVLLAPAQTLPQAPQLAVDELVLVSQPFAALPSQLRKPALHAPSWQVPAEHAALALAKAQTRLRLLKAGR